MGRGESNCDGLWGEEGARGLSTCTSAAEHRARRGGLGWQGRRHPEGKEPRWSGDVTAPTGELLSDETSVTG